MREKTGPISKSSREASRACMCPLIICADDRSFVERYPPAPIMGRGEARAVTREAPVSSSIFNKVISIVNSGYIVIYEGFTKKSSVSVDTDI